MYTEVCSPLSVVRYVPPYVYTEVCTPLSVVRYVPPYMYTEVCSPLSVVRCVHTSLQCVGTTGGVVEW